MSNNARTLSCFLLFIVLLTGCKKDLCETDPQEGKEYFVSAIPVGSFTKTQLQEFATKVGFGNFTPLARYDVAFYKLIYRTTFKNKQIQVSGLLAVPQNVPGTPSLLSAQHGTMFRAADAPSNFPATFSGFELFASAGFITVIPDYIGYGASQNLTHPYYDQQYSGLTVVNMLQATKYYLQKEKIAHSKRLFLVGYSEGGYVTMAAQKEIETDPSHNLKVTAAAEGAGGYDLPVFLSVLTKTPTYSTPSLLTLIVKAYNSTYNWSRPYSDFFQQPYASRIPELLDGTKGREEIDAALTTSTMGLFQPSFYNGLLDPTKELTLKAQLAANSFLNWVPKSPTRLYHGTNDESVFFETSASTFARFQAAGAANVEFFPIPGGTHSTSIEPMMLNALPWIQSLDK